MKRTFLTCLLIVATFGALAGPMTYIVDFTVYVDGALVFQDRFLDGIPPPSAFNSVTNTSATYSTSSWPPLSVSETQGRLQMDPTKVGIGQLTDGTLHRSMAIILPLTLNQTSAFAVTARFGLTSLPRGGSFGINLNNSTSSASGTGFNINVNNAGVGCPSGASVCGYLTDTGTRTILPYATGTLNPALGDEILFKLDHPAAGDTNVDASYQYWLNGSPAGDFISLGSVNGFKYQNWVQPRFFALLAVRPTNLLNDTGITTYGDASNSRLASEPADYPGQDARYGRDAQAGAGQLSRIGDGFKGFDFTKIANDGTELPSTAQLGSNPKDWACTRDNVTGVMWEVKTTSGLRSQSHVYTWYNSDSATNGGSAGTASGGSCNAPGRCDTEKLVQDVNAVALCGYSDWRMPSVNELMSVMDYGGGVNIGAWFPNTASGRDFWSATPSYAFQNSNFSWGFEFGSGSHFSTPKSAAQYVRLVRTAR